MRRIFTIVSIILAAFSLSLNASAATFVTDDIGITITLNGEIVVGDAERLATIFTLIKPIAPNYYRYPRALILNSAGGDVVEAIRIADLVRTLSINVVTMPDGKGMCASSCFLIYVAALKRNASGIDTIKIEGQKGNLSPLGIHRPYFRGPAIGPTGASRQEQVMIEMRDYLIKSSVGHALIDKMMAHPSNNIYWLNAEEIRQLGSYSPGVEEQLIFACGYNAKRESNLSARDYLESLRSGVLNCVSDYESKTYQPLKYAAVERMRNGWRPWK